MLNFFVYCVYILYYVYSLILNCFYIALFCYLAFWPQESVNKSLSLSSHRRPSLQCSWNSLRRRDTRTVRGSCRNAWMRRRLPLTTGCDSIITTHNYYTSSGKTFGFLSPCICCTALIRSSNDWVKMWVDNAVIVICCRPPRELAVSRTLCHCILSSVIRATSLIFDPVQSLDPSLSLFVSRSLSVCASLRYLFSDIKSFHHYIQ